MAETSVEKKMYFNAIDGLRLLASVNIVLLHLEVIGGFNDMGGGPGWLFRIIKGPAFHASLFFILGGFIFTTKFAPKLETFCAREFLKKRFRELYPLHLITTLMMAALYIIKRWGTGGIDIPKLLYSLFMHLSFLWSFCPLGTEALNRPSWALSSFFLCYLLFGPALKWTARLKKRSAVMICMVLCFIPLVAWGYVYSSTGLSSDPNIYQFFHGFAPVRFFEFGLGMLLARFFMLRIENKKAWYYAIRSDIVIALFLCLIFLNLSSQFRGDSQARWFSYHIVMTPFYMIILYAVSVEKGIFARMFSMKFIQKLGRTSFYPYLLHIPLISAITLFCERALNYNKFLHSTTNVVIFMIVLYGSSYWYVYAVRNRRRATSKSLKALKP